jgi:preprotein translocase subunit SecF
VNDTIVVFDRVRENMRSMRRDNLEHIVNVAVNQTLARTVITAGTTLLSVTALFLFGGEALRGFAFTMMVGIVSGTYSTIFIAAAIAIMLQRGRPMKGQPAAATSAAERRPSRRARAS